MSNRRIQHLLGETSLEVKCMGMFAISMVVVIALTFTPIWFAVEKLIAKQNPQTGRLLVDEVVLIKHWEAFEANESYQLVRKVVQSQLTQQNFEYQVLNPGAPNENLDDFGREAIERFASVIPDRFKEKPDLTTDSTQNKTSKSASQTGSDSSDAAAEQKKKELFVDQAVEPDYVGRLNNGNYEYYQAVRAQRSCVSGFCHPELQPQSLTALPGAIIPGTSPIPPAPLTSPDTSDSPDGKLMAVVQVNIPQHPMQKLVRQAFNSLLGMGIFAVFLGLIAFSMTIRAIIIKPLTYLREVTDGVFHGNTSLRAELNTGDEFSDLGSAFNRMLRRLMSSQEELQEANANLNKTADQLASKNLQLYESNQVKSDFLSTMSHELRTPLNSILGFSEVLGGIEQLDAKQKRYVANIQSSGKLLLAMINDILDVAKMDSGKMNVNVTEFSIERIVSAQCDMARPLAEKKNIALVEDVPEGLPPLQQDQNRIQQAINNLLSNAIKFTPEGGTVKVIVKRDENDNMLVLSVSDTGIGISEEDQKKIFEKFRQGSAAIADSVMTREYTGTGLGLSIVKEICKLLQGEISVESQLAVGSVFTIRIPWILQAAPPEESKLDSELEAFSKSTFDRSGKRDFGNSREK
ncbi:MAG: HAMP domain-containing histidine kinase [Thermoguttaceae bacterium]|nr:HAMP domain-containing histidine kinase [Thermoguttaceae bacterium]